MDSQPLPGPQHLQSFCVFRHSQQCFISNFRGPLMPLTQGTTSNLVSEKAMRSGHTASCCPHFQWDGVSAIRVGWVFCHPQNPAPSKRSSSSPRHSSLPVSSVMFPSAFHFPKSLQSWNKMPFPSTLYRPLLLLPSPPSLSQGRFSTKLSLFPPIYFLVTVLRLPYLEGHWSAPICSASRPLTTSNEAKCYGSSIFISLFCSIWC